jgi:D-3-phosphoglycerate dehydrogenase / 2-oxoglutarate reductase
VTLKVVHLNLPPLPVELARERLAVLDAEVVAARCSDIDELVSVAADADALICAGVGRLLDAEGLARLPKLRHVSIWSGSTDFIDLRAFTDAGVVVSFGADACTDEVADHGMAMMLALGRKLRHWDRVMRGNVGVYVPHDPIIEAAGPMPRLSTLTCGTIGFGRAGMALARRASAFGMRFLAHDPYIPQDAGRDLGVELTSKERVLSESDFVHLYVPMKDDTTHVIGADELALMKPTGYLVNSSARAAVIDEPALYAALTTGRLAGAGLDNLEFETGTVNPILLLDNVILSPHIAHVSDQAYSTMQERVCDDVVEFFTGHWPRLVANPEVKERVALPAQQPLPR